MDGQMRGVSGDGYKTFADYLMRTQLRHEPGYGRDVQQLLLPGLTPAACSLGRCSADSLESCGKRTSMSLLHA